ncbi:MAG: hypothetical protein HYR71_03790 [Chloroflexi bacterium]|nr:hypothetical protein [Chloroflexota bacterium]
MLLEKPSQAMIQMRNPLALTANARQVLQKRYLRRGLDGQPIETPEEMFWRVASHVAAAEAPYGGEPQGTAEAYYDLLTSLRFFPNSPTFTGAGTPLGQLAACFVLPLKDDMGRDPAGIFSTLRVAALIQQTGGGNGFAFSRIRPKGDVVAASAGIASGPVGFLRVYDKAFGEVAQGGTRRGANMAVLRVDHPDVLEFIRCKAVEGEIANFNISVGITDAFMRAVERDEPFELKNPRDDSVARTVRARDIFDEIVKYAHHNGEPGALFLDAANRDNPVPHLYELEATNPCVPGDTLVATPQGWRRAEAIRAGDEICTVLGAGRVSTVEVNHQVPVFKVYLSDGGVARATAAHQFHVRDSRRKFFAARRLDELKPGDWVRVYRAAMPNNPVPPTAAELTDREHGFLIGVLVGDGCYTPHALSKNVVRVSSNADETQWNTVLEQAFAKVGAQKMVTYVNEGSRSMMMDPKPGRVIADWVKSLPLEPARGPEKRLPDVYINSNREFLTGLLDGLFSTDGSVDLSSNHPLVRFHTSSGELARQVRRILLMFGVHARIAASQRRRHDLNGRVIRHDRTKYDVTISGESFGRFFEQIRLSHHDKQMRLEDAALRSNFTGGNWAARVLKVEPDGLETVYDLYEPRSDTWITEGYVSRGCGEQWLGPYENCCLGSINLAQHLTPDRRVDWRKLEESAVLATRFLDDVVDANQYVPAVPELRQAALQARRLGLGIMGLGDMMYDLGIRYGSAEGEEFAAQVMEFIHYHSMQVSVGLAKERGPFPAITGSRFDPHNLQWTPPVPLTPYTRDFGRPALNWPSVVRGIQQYGIRNAANTTIAPTGTIATVAGVESYGCEPVFALAYLRHFNDQGKDVELQYTSPRFERALSDAGVPTDSRRQIIQQVNLMGNCQSVAEVPEAVKHTFVVASDITPEEHVRMQAALQCFISNSLSKTCNFPESATPDDVAKAYFMAWRLGCKGLTVYVAGTREKVVLETQATRAAKEKPQATAPANAEIKPRPRRLSGTTLKVESPLGTAYVTINSNGHDEPFEVFVNVGKAGSDVAADAEAIGRLVSLALRSSPDARKSLREVGNQLAGIGGGRSLGFGQKRVRSLADAVAQAINDYLGEAAAVVPQAPMPTLKATDICSECGVAAVVNEEGCRKCYSCGHSEC